MEINIVKIKNLIRTCKIHMISRLFLNDFEIKELKNIPELFNCLHLKKLTLSSNQITDITELERLKELKSLDLSSNQISELKPLEKHIGLKSLKLQSNNICDISALEKLTELEYLDLSFNEIKDIRPLRNLTKLKVLYLNYNFINDIKCLEKLSDLQDLSLSINGIKEIPLFIFNLNLKPNSINEFGGLNIDGNPIELPPIEIINQGKNSVIDWYQADKVKLKEIKIILIGDPKAGKTSLLRRLKYDTFDENEVQTDGVNIEDIEFGNCNTFKNQGLIHDITGHFWDFGGQEIMNSTHKFFLTKRSIYILMLDARKDTNVSSQLSHWIKRIKTTGGNSTILVVANQIDINTGFGFENEYELQKEFPQIKSFIKISCKLNENIEFLKDKLAEFIPQTELFHTDIDQRWIRIKENIQKEVKENHFVNETKFLEICNEYGLTEKRKQKNAISFLHDLGLVLHFDEINLSEYYVLDPYWITYGVYQILTSSYAGANNGVIPIQQLEFIINEEKDKLRIYKPSSFKRIHYTSNHRRFLVEMLYQFKLCFCLSDFSQLILPDLITTKEPLEVTEPIRQIKDSISFVYDYSYLPNFIMPNIIVDNFKDLLASWRTGCVIQNDNCKALITNYQNRINIIVIGEPKRKREFMAVIRYQMDSITYKLSEKPRELIPLPNIEAYAEYEVLLNREKKGKKYYVFDEDKSTEQEFEISKLLEGIPTKDEVSEVKVMLNKVLLNQKVIIDTLDLHYKYLINSPQNDNIKEEVINAVEKLQDRQAKEISNEIIKWISNSFDLLVDELDDRFRQIYSDLIKTDNVQMKLKLGIPFINLLGVNFETELDVKSWALGMYKKHELKIFKLMGY